MYVLDAVDNEPIVLSALLAEICVQDFESLFGEMGQLLEKEAMRYWIIDSSCMKLSQRLIEYISDVIAVPVEGGFNDYRLAYTVFVCDIADMPVLEAAMAEALKQRDTIFHYRIFATLSYAYDFARSMWHIRRN